MLKPTLTPPDLSAALPPPVVAVWQHFFTAELTTLGRGGRPITWPIMPIFWPERGEIVLFTSIGLPQKAFNIRRDPRVALLYSDPTGSDLTDPPAVLVQGRATVRGQVMTRRADGDPELWRIVVQQAQKMIQRQPATALYLSHPLIRYLMDWYFMRLLITIRPEQVLWWAGRNFAAPPQSLVVGPAENPAVRADHPHDESLAGRPDPLRSARRHLPAFDSAVVSGLDDRGRPYSLRCRPLTDGPWLRLDLPAYAPLMAGPASLLCHRHDERLWNLKSFVLRGALERRATTWRFRPARFSPGAGIGGPVSYLRFLVQGRRNTTRYLKRRGMARPAIAWTEWQELLAAARAEPERPVSMKGGSSG